MSWYMNNLPDSVLRPCSIPLLYKLKSRRDQFFMHCFSCKTNCKTVGGWRRWLGVSSQLSCVLGYCQLLTVGFITECVDNLIPRPTGGSTLPQIPPCLLGATSVKEKGEGVEAPADLWAAIASCPCLILEGVCKSSAGVENFPNLPLKAAATKLA